MHAKCLKPFVVENSSTNLWDISWKAINRIHLKWRKTWYKTNLWWQLAWLPLLIGNDSQITNRWRPSSQRESLRQLGIGKIAAWRGSVPQAVSGRFAKRWERPSCHYAYEKTTALVVYRVLRVPYNSNRKTFVKENSRITLSLSRLTNEAIGRSLVMGVHWATGSRTWGEWICIRQISSVMEVSGGDEFKWVGSW